MRKDKLLATTLRREGKSYREIYHTLRIPRATLSDWFGKEEWSQKIKLRVTETANSFSKIRLLELNKIRGRNLARAYDQAKTEAYEEFQLLKYDPLFISGIMLYWGEGDKRGRSQVRIINTDAEMIKLFVIFLKYVCKIPIEKIGGSVIRYPDLIATDCNAYWAATSGLHVSAFNNGTTIIGRHKTRKLSHGICQIFVSSTYFKAKMLEWLRLLPQELMREK